MQRKCAANDGTWSRKAVWSMPLPAIRRRGSPSPVVSTYVFNPLAVTNGIAAPDRKSTRLNSSHSSISYAVFRLNKKITGNVVRSAGVGIAVSVTPGAGSAVIADNLISGAKNGAIVGLDQRRAVTGDLAREGAGR